jgi:hypothetical protein
MDGSDGTRGRGTQYHAYDLTISGIPFTVISESDNRCHLL